MTDQLPASPLTNDFPAATREDWRRRVETVLKGADFERVLVGRTYDGIAIEPLYERAAASRPVQRETAGAWRIAQRVDHPDLAEANALALTDLAGGADSLTLVCDRAPAARGFGLSLGTVEDLDRALSGVMLDLIHLRLDAGGRGRQLAALFVALADKRGHALASLSVDLGLDPLGAMAASGVLSTSWDIVATRMVETQQALTDRGFAGRTFLADGRPYHEAGGSEAMELAAVLATGVAYWRALEAGGVLLETGRDALSFLLVADSDEFLTMAKFRALRRLWARVEQACGLTPKPVRLHAETSWRTTTRRDPWVNMLRATLSTFSAGLGGADAITILPFTTALGLPDAFARRVARNTHLILIEEAHLARVEDPASGAGGFEALTDALCEKAWAIFQGIERDGGLLEILKTGALQRDIAATRATRDKDIATRRDPITGTSEFPNLHEGPVAVLKPSPLWPPSANSSRSPAGKPAAPASPTPFSGLIADAAAGSSLSDLGKTAKGPDPVAVAPLPSSRDAEPFELLRDRADAHASKTGSPPRLFLATLGRPASFTARATFAKNLFEAGGIETVMADGDQTLATLRDAFRTSGASLACLCAPDEAYQTDGVAAVAALKAAGAAAIYVAGRPGDLGESLSAAGAAGFVHLGCDVLACLDQALTLALGSAARSNALK